MLHGRVVIELGILRQVLDPVDSVLVGPGLVDITTRLLQLMLSVDDLLQWFRVLYPLESAEPVADGHNFECLDEQITTLTSWIPREDLVDGSKDLLDALIQSQVLSSLYQQVIVLFIRAVDCDALRSSLGAKDEAHLLETGYLDVSAGHLLLVMVVLSLTWNLDVVLGDAELVASELIHPLRVALEHLRALVQALLVHPDVQALETRLQLLHTHLLDSRPTVSELPFKVRHPNVDELLIVDTDLLLNKPLARSHDVLKQHFNNQVALLAPCLITLVSFKVFVGIEELMEPVAKPVLREDHTLESLGPLV